LSAEVATSYGLSPVFIIHDELGQVKGPRSELYEALETATGAQDEPLSLIISTQARTDSDLLSMLIDDAIAEHDPHTVVSLYTAPMEDEPFSEATIAKANPAFGDFLNRREVLNMAKDAERMPSREAEFRNLILNQRVETSAPFVTRSLWASCGTPPLPIDSVPVYGGLDLSEVADLTALVLVGRVDGRWQVHPTFWLPAEGLIEKSHKDKVTYDVWKDRGYLQAAPGKSIDYDYVAAHLKECFGKYKIKKIAFDRWNFKHLKPYLLRAGFSERQIEEHFVEFGQGFQSMSPALRALEVEILNARLAHGNHPILQMCAANAVVQTDPAGNKKLAKNKSAGRIDGMVALTMAMGAVPMEEPKPTFQMFTIG
jgi:phage terminase large subunit-like protein